MSDARWMAEECAVQAEAAAEAWRTFEDLADHAQRAGFPELEVKRLVLAREYAVHLMVAAVRAGELLKNIPATAGAARPGSRDASAAGEGGAAPRDPAVVELRA